MRGGVLAGLMAAAAMAQGAMEFVITSDVNVAAIAFQEDGKSIAGRGEGRLRLWDTTTGAVKWKFDPTDGNLSFLPQPGRVARGRSDGSLEILAIPGGSVIGKVSASAAEGRPAFSRDGTLIARPYRVMPRASETFVRVRDATGREKFAAPAGLGGVSVMDFSPDGKFLVAGANDTDLRVWNVQSGELVRVIDEMLVTMFAIAFSPDGKSLALAGADRIVYLYDTASWKLSRKLAGQPEMISAMEFSPDGRRLVTGGFSELTVNHPVKVVLWDVASGKMLRTFGAPRQVSSAVFSPDGKIVAAAYGAKTITLFPIAD
ncbi:MAG: hypothetical protein SFV54_27045 [Bryobacteraceae bacterium]|nr:hypothetical protein [Bryobacteraceae bacterium]